MCIAAWNAAIKLECDFVEDINLMDTRITLSLDALIHKCEVAISNDDMEQMGRYLEDVRITGPGTDDDGTKGCGYLLLRQAILNDSVKVVRLLVSRGYSLTKPYSDGLLPIHETWGCGEDMVGLLLESGASHLDCDAEGNNIWHLTASEFECNTLSALLKLTGAEKISALQMQNEQGFTPLTLAIHKSIETLNDSGDSEGFYNEGDAAAAIELLLDACGCAGSPWHLVARSGSIAAIKRLKESGVPLQTIQEGQCTPLHVLDSPVSKGCVELLKTLFPTANSILYQSRTPLQRFIYNCIAQRIVPQQGVIESLADAGIAANTIHTHCDLWDYFCTDILGSITLVKNCTFVSLNSIVEEILQMKAIEAYEELKGQSATISFFSGLLRSEFLCGIRSGDLETIMSRTRLWSPARVATQTTEYVKRLIIRIATSGADTEMPARTIQILLDKGVSIDLRSGSSSILEEACQSLACGERDANDRTIASSYEVQRGVFAAIVDRARLEPLNASQPETGGYLEILALKGYHYGSSWMIEKLMSKGLDPNKLGVGPNKNSLLVECLDNSATPAALLLLELGADPILRKHNQQFNALHVAALRGQLDFLKSLWSKFQANPTTFPWQETTNVYREQAQLPQTFHSVNALHLAALEGHLSSLQFLINNDLSPDAKSTSTKGYNCLHFAAISGSREAIDYLFSLGLDINQPADDGSLPIHFAVQFRKESAVQTLVELGSATYADGVGMTPQMYAGKLGYSEIRDLLENCQTNTQDYVTGRAMCRQNRGLKLLLKILESAIEEGSLETCNDLYRQV
ncbi:ankyrin repeat-containing domain protein [Xylaria digitata]|nr:ankyrin repeat-containing domain protein [Xylaria digitata]